MIRTWKIRCPFCKTEMTTPEYVFISQFKQTHTNMCGFGEPKTWTNHIQTKGGYDE